MKIGGQGASITGSLELRDQSDRSLYEKTIYFAGYDILQGGVLQILELDGRETLYGPGCWEKFSFNK